MSMSREEVINALRTYSSNDWGVIRQPFSGWCWAIDDKSEEPYLYSEKEHIDKRDVFPEAATTQSLETELADLINLPVTVRPEAYIDYRHRLLRAVIDRIKQAPTAEFQKVLDTLRYPPAPSQYYVRDVYVKVTDELEKFYKLFDGLVALLPNPAPAQTTESLLSKFVDMHGPKPLSTELSELINTLNSNQSLSTVDNGHKFATQEIIETRAMYEKAAAAHNDLRVRFGEMMGVSGPSNDEMVEFAYQANSGCSEPVERYAFFNGKMAGPIIGEHPARDNSIVVWHYEKQGFKVYHPHQVEIKILTGSK